jgi:hypothetical protein
VQLLELDESQQTWRLLGKYPWLHRGRGFSKLRRNFMDVDLELCTPIHAKAGKFWHFSEIAKQHCWYDAKLYYDPN